MFSARRLAAGRFASAAGTRLGRPHASLSSCSFQSLDSDRNGAFAARGFTTMISTSRLPEERSLEYDRAHDPMFAARRTQLRFRRHDRSSAFSTPRPATQKQRRKHNRKMAAERKAQAKINPPGFHAGPKRQAKEEHMQYLLRKEQRRIAAEEKGMDLVEYYKKEVLPPKKYDIHSAMLDDLIGNTAHWTSTPTPQPTYIAHKHTELSRRLQAKMNAYHAALEEQVKLGAGEGDLEEGTTTALAHLPALPNDHDVGRVIRAFKDKFGTRNKPVGIVKALQHTLQDLRVPIYALGPVSYMGLLRCCSSVVEARRIMVLMADNGYTPNVFHWSALVELHARDGDYKNCKAVMEEMVAEGVPPVQTMYTSLLAACYKITNNGRIAFPIRRDAWNVGWEAWKEMRIVGIDADAMSYGAMIRLCASRGLAEQALGLLEEMKSPVFDVKPTTLCFAAALNAVSRSHASSIRFLGGARKKDMTREKIAAHHGTMARTIVLMAEQAEVDQNDDAYISALIGCAAAAGDSATAKAILLASEVRKLTHLRPIGSDEHLAKLKLGRFHGQPDEQDLIGSGLAEMEQLEAGSSETNGEQKQQQQLMSQSDGTITTMSGNDTSLATMQSETSLQTSTSSLKEPTKYEFDFKNREYGGNDARVMVNLLRACAVAAEKNGIGSMWEGSQNEGYLCIDSLRLLTQRRIPKYVDKSIPGMTSTEAGLSALQEFDQDARDRDRKPKPHVRRKYQGLYIPDDAMMSVDDLDEDYLKLLKDDLPEHYQDGWERKHIGGLRPAEDPGSPERRYEERMAAEEKKKQEEKQLLLDQEANDMYFDYGSMKWKSRKEEAAASASAASETISSAFLEQSANGSDDESESSVDGEDLSEADHRVLDLLQSYNMGVGEDDEISGGVNTERMTSRTQTFVVDADDAAEKNSDQELAALLEEMGLEPNDEESKSLLQLVDDINSERSVSVDESTEDSVALSDHDIKKQNALADLREVLPGMPESRLERVYEEFENNLNTPSMLSLVPILRETMPDYVDRRYLKKLNIRNARYVMARAEEAGMINHHMLNSMLIVLTSMGDLVRAERFYYQEFPRHNVTPNDFANRAMIKMYVQNNRLPRALEFKRYVEEELDGTIDLAGYGELVQYFGKSRQLGSALMTMRECIQVHGSPPNHGFLREVRKVARREGHEMIVQRLSGEDPGAWVREGLKKVKRTPKARGKVSRIANKFMNI